MKLTQFQTVTFHRAFVDIGGSINAALLLSNAIYWTNRLPAERDGWFYKTKEEWEKETGLSRKEQDRARQQLIERGLLEVRRSKIAEDECVTALWFRVNVDALQVCLASEDQKPQTDHCQKPLWDATKSPKPAFGLLIDKRTSITTSTPPPPRARAVLLSPDWTPKREVFALLTHEGIPEEFSQSCLAEFRLYWATRAEARADWNSVFARQVRSEFAYQAKKHEQQQRTENRPNLSQCPSRQSGRPRKETLAERCARYDRFAAGLDAGLDASKTACEATPGEFFRH